MGNQKPPTPTAKENTAANTIVNGTEKQKISRAINMIFYWVRYIIRQNHFQILRKEGNKDLADYVTKNHPIWQHITMIPRYLKPTQKDIENSK